MNLAKNWWIFVKERFPLASHIPMVALFSLGNMAVTNHLATLGQWYGRFPLIFVMAFLFFFRLRCFDEIKDYEVDLKVNPTRPLARGVLSVKQVKIMIGVVSVLEVLIAAQAGENALYVHAVAMLYSFFMYKEFFIGDYLRPHLTTYAVTHTFVSMLLGLSIAAQTTGIMHEALFRTVIVMAPINWSMFNLFEFARKTFAPVEERPHVESYSSLFGPWGAMLLSLSQVILALVFLYFTHMNGFLYQVLGAMIPVLAGLYFVTAKSAKAGSAFRANVGAYLLLFYIGLFCQAYFSGYLAPL